MLTGERRGISARRGGMTVLGKVAVPKPVNLPSQRLENRGLDPNVEIVPKGTVSWRSAGRSPPTSGNAWGTVSSSSPPTNAGPWSRSHVSTNRPSSGGSGTRPSTAGSDQSHEAVTPNAWGSVPNRPSSASASMGLAHSQSTVTRPCSAESRLGSSQLSRFADSSVEAGGVWGGSGTAQKLGENHPQPTQFTLTSVDFPTLGSDKNPDLRPQHGNASIRSVSTSEGLALEKERPRSSPAGWGEDASTGTPTGQDRGTVDTWKRELSYPGEMPVPDEGRAQRGDLHRPSYGGLPHTPDSWHCDDGHRTMASNAGEGDWHRGGPPVGQYCPPGGPGRFPLNPSGYMRPPFEFGPVPFAPGPSGPGTYNRHGEIYGPFMRQPTMVPGRPGLPLGHGMYPNQMPYDGYYGPPGVGGPNYGSIDERDMAMLRMGGGPGMYGGYPHHQGPLEAARFRHGGPSSGSHQASFHSGMPREHNDASAYNRAAGEGAEKAFPKQSDGWVPKDSDISRDNSRPFFSRDANLRRNPVVPANISQRESSNPRGSTTGHRDWGAAVNIDEPMDFSKPVFDEEDLSRQGFLQENASGMRNDSGPEKGAKMQRVAEVIRDKRNVQVKTRDIGDSRKYSTSDDVSRVGKGNGTEVDGGKAVQLEGQFPAQQEYPSEAGGVSIGKRNSVARSVDDKIQGGDLEITSLQVGEKSAYSGGEAISSTQQPAYTVDRSCDLGERAQASVKSLKTLDQQCPTDGPKRVPVVSTPSSERDSSLNTTAKLTGGLSSAAGLNDVPCETLQTRDKGDKVHLLKRSDNHTTHNMMDTEEVMEKVQESQGASGTREVPGKEGHRMKSRFNVHERDNEWRRKGPAVELSIKASKVNAMTSSNASNQIGGFSVSGASTTVPGTSSDKHAGDPQAQQSVESYDYEVQRARMKEIAVQRAKQLQREEEERTKEQKAKALAKLEELNRRALAGVVSQDVGHPKQEDSTKLNNGSEVTSDIQEQQAVNFEGKNPRLENNAGDNENVAGHIIGHLGEIEKGKSENDQRITNVSIEDQKSQMNLGEQKDLVKGGASGSNNNSMCEAPAVQVSSSPEIPGRLGKNADDSLGQSGKYEKGKQENYRRIGSFNRENPRSQMKMDDNEDLVKERVSLPSSSTTSDAPALPMSATQVSGTVLTSPGSSEVLHQDVPLPESVSPRNTDQFRQRGFPKQAQMRHKVKQYATQQRFSGTQQSTLEKTEQCVASESGPSTQRVSENNETIVSNYVADEKNTPNSSFGLAISASGSDGPPIARKKKNNRNIKSKQKSDRHVTNISSVGSAEHDLGKIAQPNSTDQELKQAVEEVNTNFVKPPGTLDSNKDAYILTGKSELASVESVEDDVAVAPKDALASDARLSESMGDTSMGRMPHLKSQLPKRSYKGSQDARVLEKFQGNEGRVWAPVRSVNHNGAGYENKKLNQSGAEVQPSGDVNNEVVGQNPIRNRRAEMERYVPKPVAKEQAQHQENGQQSAGASVSAQFHTAHSSVLQGTPQNLQTVPLRQQHSYAGGNRGNGVGSKHGKPNVSWRQRNSNEISENKDSSALPSSEVERVSSVQTNEATETWQADGQTQNLKSEGPGIHLPSEQLNVQKAKHMEQLPKSTSAQVNRQHSPHSEVQQGSQIPTVPHLQESIAVKEHDLQLASKREQTTHERFYQANRARSKLNKAAVRQSNTEGNHHILAPEFNKLEGVNNEREKTRLMDQIYPHQRPRSSGSWTPRQQGPTDDKEHLLHQHTKSVVQSDVGQVMVGSHDEHQRLQRQSSQQTRLSSTQYSKAVAHRQETSESSAKQQHMQDLSSWEQPVSPHHLHGKKEGLHLDVKLETNHIPQQQSKSTHSDWQEAEKDQQKQTPISTLYQHRQQSSAQSHWQQTGANSSAGVPRRTDSHEEHLRSTVTQNLKQQGTTVPRTESSHGAGQYHRQDTNRHQAHINSDSKKQNSQVQLQSVSHQKPQEFYQPKPKSASGQGYKQEMGHGTTSQNSSPWAGDHKSGPVYHDRDHNHARRGRPGGRSGGGTVARAIESESKSEHPSKQRLVIDATGGCVGVMFHVRKALTDILAQVRTASGLSSG